MIRRSLMMISLVLAAIAASAQQPMAPIPVQPGNWETARRIPRDAAIRMVDQGKAVFVDIRSFETYSKGHIKGAISIPRSQLIHRLREVPPGKLIITYCACVREHTAALAVTDLVAHGVNNSAALTGGWNEWAAARLPVATGALPK
ncbi:MAG TPA: rhodanese-like domain-containing protein [Thermoanaerobaculia bacterium]|nr:rhodanese-like domain-containing protein [Thermoanaerobaculia bacterium]